MRAIRASALYGAGTVLLLGAAFPLFWMLSTALKPSGEIFATPRFVPLHPTLENFQRLFADTAFLVFSLSPLAPRPELGHVDTEPVPSQVPA